MLKLLKFKGVYRSEGDNLLEDFYVPALSQSVRYDRAVGFFSSAMLSYAAEGISKLLENGGRMRLIFGGEISEDDLNAMTTGYEMRSSIQKLGLEFVSTIEQTADRLAHYRLTALSWMVANGWLDIKLALKRRGMYHEKIGIFTDANGDQVVFQGSANETAYALLPDFNFESINVFPSWRVELSDHFVPYIDGFERLWNNTTRDTIVVDFPEAAKAKLIEIAKNSKPPTSQGERTLWLEMQRRQQGVKVRTEISVPEFIDGRPFKMQEHQLKALNAWRAREFRGILAMATGSGKTFTAIYGAVRIFQKIKRLFLVIAVPYQALADQWVDELTLFGIQPIRCYEARESWYDEITQRAQLFKAGVVPFIACVVVNRTLATPAFQEILERVDGKTLLFVGDECHNHAAENVSSALPRQAQMRLGLSATPEHYFDVQRTSRLSSYYGEIAYEYTLAEAMDKVLCPYKYHLHFVELTQEEAERYVDLSQKLARMAANDDAESVERSGDSSIEMLLFQRARLLANAERKIDALMKALSGTSPSPFYLFFCGDGAVEGNDDNGIERQADIISKNLFNLGWRVAHFTSRQSARTRQAELERFRIGETQALVAIRCLDEGIDVPDCRVAHILASGRNPRQFIQRRGRLLRSAPGKEEAVLHDYVVMLPDLDLGVPTLERNLFLAELRRIAEFARLAKNRGEAYMMLRPILKRYDLEHYLI
ncbi:hypothetical protein WR30_00110 [Burkholderia contaminans FFH2055]|uniref:DEAD/DEAH box helicase family protein n=3 Tax=Burkholderia contaminans TaxID=488447 RepID=UPI0006349893|nr:DEAD/DEAH box helicase family protein [Burkholderia contaminans]KKL36631.1 hypothetical protein WR30_00110 [Burkholderia contaminans FFH2055]MEB4633717.1 DEAD/DEAH box helicase family protein [Burkholderia contaminans]MEB4638562.1 DEAD/DEAH box helicase family protein [Burkholderia contaminans]MEB4657624.1 DEAD/DEAH box helicase family protein [Burkholderia contaminans]MEB4665574.1 DEAD/DEAH box helicase family protein [Burkholderia contaminans]